MALRRNTRFKNRVRQLRINRGLEPKDLCELLGIGQSSLSEIERNINIPGDEIMVRMHDLLGWTPGDILYVEPGVLHTEKSPRRRANDDKNTCEKIS